MNQYKYMRIKLSNLPENTIKEYGLTDKVTAYGYAYVEIRRGMYGLPQAGLLAQQLLEKQFNKEGYHQSALTPGFWKHDWRPISITLRVNNFGIKYVGQISPHIGPQQGLYHHM